MIFKLRATSGWATQSGSLRNRGSIGRNYCPDRTVFNDWLDLRLNKGEVVRDEYDSFLSITFIFCYPETVLDWATFWRLMVVGFESLVVRPEVLGG